MPRDGQRLMQACCKATRGKPDNGRWTMRSVRWSRVHEPGCAEIFFVPFLFRADANYCTTLTDVFGIFSDFFAEERNKIATRDAN